MKKTLEVKNIMFMLSQEQKAQTTPNPNQNILSKIDSTLSDHKCRATNMFKRQTDPKTYRKLSQNTQKTPKKPKVLPTYQLSQKHLRPHCSIQSRPSRYNNQNPFAQSAQEPFLKSKSNLKIASLHFKQQTNSTEATPLISQKKMTTSLNWEDFVELKKGRMKSEPTNAMEMKNQIMQRVSKKIQFMKKMTLDPEDPQTRQRADNSPSQGSKLFNFDRLYDHCLKKINRNLNSYQKDYVKSKDKKYYELKIQSTILSNQLQSMRKSLTKKNKEVQNNLGVIGNLIDLNKMGASGGGRLNSQRGQRESSRPSSCYRKKLSRITRNVQGKNPFKGQLDGWQIRAQKQEQFLL